MSGQHVVFGFLRPLARQGIGQLRISVIHYSAEQVPMILKRWEYTQSLCPKNIDTGSDELPGSTAIYTN